MNVEIANTCPRCDAPVLVAPMHAGGVRPAQFGDTRAYDLALGYQCLSCDWYVVQPASNTMSAADFLGATVGASTTGGEA